MANASCPMLHSPPRLDSTGIVLIQQCTLEIEGILEKIVSPQTRVRSGIILSDWWFCRVFALDPCLGWVPRRCVEGGMQEQGGWCRLRAAPNHMHSEWFPGKTERFGLNIKGTFTPTDPGWE